MGKTFDQGKNDVAKLCRYFETNRQLFLAPGVKEAHIRQSLIDPFFIALGWDVHNESKTAPQYREVIPEDSLDVEGHLKAPDYTFRVGSQAKFYTEAKKCGINIDADPGPAYQLRRYGWSAKVVLSLLTDFDELGVYDCTLRPRPSDKASHARVQYFRFEEYPDRWRELWDYFSREAVWSGAFDQYAASKRKRGTSEVDAEFLKEIEGWRDELARNVALRNPVISLDDLNAAILLTIDRIVFLRMAEDRGIEPYEQLLKLCERPDIYSRFMRDLCRKADEKYNSGLFHFQKEVGIPDAPDRITPNLSVDDKVVKPILQSLYFEFGSPYHFGVMPVEILGTVYERFLGKVIRLTEGHQAKIEEKPEVRKAGGVYYTPSYIVDYIVKNTVGKQIKGKSPAQLAGGKSAPPFRVLDMACGSGSFLLGAYRCLLDHSLKWYTENKPESYKKAVWKDPRNGECRLTIEEKKRILIAHIFGVDIDPQAVEVSKLSLLLKVLEGETDQSFGRQMQLYQDRTLPNLSDNLKCGNSLIGPDYIAGRLDLDPEELKRVNPFDWNQAFPEAMKAGGFDCVIGNPPYVRIQTMKEWAPLEVEIYKEQYTAAGSGNYDIYVVFIEKGLSLLNKHGRLGLILPHKFFNARYGEPLRALLAKGKHLGQVVHFGDQQVFSGATTYTCLLFLDRAGSNECQFVKVNDLAAWRATGKATESIIPVNSITSAEWNFAVGKSVEIFERLSKMSVKLGDIAHTFVGTQTSADDVFVLDNCRQVKKQVVGMSRSLGQEVKVEAACTVPFLRGKEIRRYQPLETEARLICPYEISKEECQLLSLSEMGKRFPLALAYLEVNKLVLAERERGRLSGQNWYAFAYPKSMTLFQIPKIVVPDYNNIASFTFDSDGHFYKTGYGVILKNTSLSPFYVLGLLNSQLLFRYLVSIGTSLRGGYVRFWTQFIEQLPIRWVDLTSDPADVTRHDRMVKLVEQMLQLHKQQSTAKSDADRELYQRQIDSTDREIDRLVYELYGLTKDEIKVVEEGKR